MTVPVGTVAEVLGWVGDDPERAREALDAEYAGQNRSTLIAQLEAIADKEATDVTEETATYTEEGYDEETGLAPGPEPPEVEVDPTDTATTVLPTVLSGPEVEHEPEYDDDGIEVLPSGTVVESIGGAVAPHGCILVLNGEGFVFSPQMLAALRMQVNTFTAGVTL